MATDVGRSKPAAIAKHDAFVQAQLARAEQRIRALDLTAALLGFAAGTLAYAVVMALLDHWLGLPAGARQAAFVLYLLAAVVYLAWSVALPLSRRINPYFAARQIERTLPGAKNSVVNWLDLHGRDLPPAIHGAVGQRAAKDLARADLEKAVSGRRAWTAGSVAAVCTVAFLVALFTLGPAYFFGFLSRVFAPFGGAGAAAAPTATQITLVKPAEGDAVVPDDRPVDILVRLAGRTPDPRAADAPRLLFRYDPQAPYQQRPLDADEAGRWGVTLPPVDVKDGFWYKVAAGDAETPEYRVRLTPRLLDFRAVYHFRPYTARAAEARRERKIEALRGTQVDVTAHANRDVKDGWIQYESPAGVTTTQADRLPDDPQGFVVHLPPLNESCQYRIGFTSAEGETFTEAQSYPLVAVPDKAPEVTLTKPAELKDKPGWVPPLHANDVLPLEGSATDDVGVRSMRLNLRVENGPTADPQEYRTPKDYELGHGGNPTKVEYKDFVDLTKLKEKVKDPSFAVRPGMVLEYWLTAEDACDYPKPNVGESKHYKVQIVEPLNNDKVQQQQRDKAAQDKKETEQKQDKDQKAEDQKRNEENQKREQQCQKGDQNGGGSGGAAGKDKPKDDGGKNGSQGAAQGTKPNEPNQGGPSQPKPGDQHQPGMGDTNSGDKPQEGSPSGSQANNSAQNQSNPNAGDQHKDGNDLQKQAQAAGDQLRKDTEGSGKADAKQQPAEGKDGGELQPQPADGKGGGEQAAKDAAQPKGGPQDQPAGQHDEAAAKDGGQSGPMQPQQGEAKAGGEPKAQPDAQPGQGKDGQTQPAPTAGANKDGGKPDDVKQAAADKPQPGAAGDMTNKADAKEGNPQGMTADARPSEAKDKASPETKAEAKGMGQDKPDKDAANSEAKAGGPTPMGAPEKGSAKDAPAKPDESKVAETKSDGSGGAGEPPSDQTEAKNLDDAFKKLKDDLNGNDPRKREIAEEFIRRYLQNADDPQVRDRANKTLQDAGLDPADDRRIAQAKPPEPDGPKTPQDQPGAGKSTGDKDNPSTAKENPPPSPTGDPAKGEPKGDGKPKDGDPMHDQTPPPGAVKEGRGNGGQPGRRDHPPPSDTPAPPPLPQTPEAQRASALQLLNFYQAVPQDVLKDALLDPEKLKALEAAARDYWAKRGNGGPENPAAPQHGGALSATAGKTSTAGGQPPTDDPNNGGRPAPPPGYREPYKEFTKLLTPGGQK